jgi:hypothetical protein
MSCSKPLVAVPSNGPQERSHAAGLVCRMGCVKRAQGRWGWSPYRQSVARGDDELRCRLPMSIESLGER